MKTGIRATLACVEAAIRALLTMQGYGPIEGAFVYGSVAAGSATTTSDIDCFVLTATSFDAAASRGLKSQFAELQRELGYRPDPDYPLELFPVDTCRMVLASPQLRSALRVLADGESSEAFRDSDDAEVLRAFLGRRVTVIDSPCLDELTRDAATVLRSTGSDLAAVLAALGVKHLAVTTETTPNAARD